ncbi:MAG TPA: hypothetical protein VNF24_08110 [Candidatus Acidoferrales bacterium]|nr:hypothetical protein [Candidatus Acidoferrales bacterium]
MSSQKGTTVLGLTGPAVRLAAEPVFTEGAGLPLLGLLLALPTLTATGLLEEASDLFGQLRNGFYGLRASLLTFFFLALIREPRAEGATRIVPADLGRVLGGGLSATHS